ncbi:uncharacterized protein LOC121247294 [Juglans microcarpa x Juglans regia]|uniref:uncharacterized protein LOC121247294 n=1 Tax=Juglans microcarpa x Juglans regia TaxID=2249226 RepID=UPI001B7F2779|nr:uncharacterized protein LOC121247294 [Juglans microcarpa x Juglans regia]
MPIIDKRVVRFNMRQIPANTLNNTGAEEFLGSKIPANPLTYPSQTHQWLPPLLAVYKVNWDSAVDKVHCKVGIGAIFRDWEGRVIACMRMCRPIHLDPYLVEAFGALQSAIMAVDIGLKHIYLEGDALNVINDINGNKESWGQTGLLVHDVQQVMKRFDSTTVNFIPRSCNNLAHCLAKDALNVVDILVNLEDVPSYITSLL